MNCELWREIGTQVLSKYANKKTIISVYTFRTFFKMPPRLVNMVWEKLISKYPDSKQKDLLWTLHYLKTQSGVDEEIASLLSTNRVSLLFFVELPFI
jgi:hypothetical protein